MGDEQHFKYEDEDEKTLGDFHIAEPETLRLWLGRKRKGIDPTLSQ